MHRMILGLIYVVLVSAFDPLIDEICTRAPHVAVHAHGWCSPGVDVCKWAGVRCADGSASEITLRDVPLMLELPLVALASTSLQSVRLIGCQLTGSLNATTKGDSLVSLDLSDNQLTGLVPRKLVESMVTLELRNCALDSAAFVDVFCEPTPLMRLDLSNNKLRGDLSACIGGGGAMSAYRYFNISHNELSGRAPVPAASTTYDVSHNSFSSIEEVHLERTAIDVGGTIMSLPVLRKCNMAANQLRGNPPAWTTTVTWCKF